MIVGAGTIGMIIARDAAACGFSTIALEKDAVVGGVWSKNDYPGLRLQTSGASYRCFSLVPLLPLSHSLIFSLILSHFLTLRVAFSGTHVDATR